MTDRYVYLYRITLNKEGEDPLYYFGIRFGFYGKPEDDDYMGSPQTHKNLWEDPSYTKTKEILKSTKVGSKDDIDSYAELETDIIREAWQTYGLYHKGGQCLNMAAGKLYLHTEETRKEIAKKCSEYWTGNPLHPMKRPEHRKRKSEQMKKLLEEHPEKNPNNLPGVREKHKQRLLRDNPMHRPEIAAKVKGKNNPMYGKKHSEEKKLQISKSVKLAHSDPEVKKKLSETSKKRWEDPEYKKKLSDSHKRRWEEWRKKRQTNTLENYFD